MNTLTANSLRLLPAASDLQGGRKALSWAFQLIAAGILASTLPFKFTEADGSLELFQAVGAGRPGLYGTAVLELIAVALLLTPRLAVLGAGLAAGLMVGAIGTHVFVVGLEWQGSYQLFAMAVATMTASLAILTLRRRELPLIGEKLG